jgi:hypothetical protein
VIPSRAVLQVQAGTADYSTNVTAAQEPALAAGSGPGSPAATKGMQQYVVNSLDNLWLYALNTRRPLFSNLQVRQAVNYAVDRTALAHNGGGLGPPRQPTDQYLPPGIPGYHNVPVYPLTPDLAKARQLAPGLRATAVLYTCNESTCIQDAQILKNDLAAIGLNVQVHQFPYPVLYDLVSHTGPWDIADIGWRPDYPDPANFLNYLLEGGTVIPPFNNQRYHQRLTQAAEMSGPTRYLTYGETRPGPRPQRSTVDHVRPHNHPQLVAGMGSEAPQRRGAPPSRLSRPSRARQRLDPRRREVAPGRARRTRSLLIVETSTPRCLAYAATTRLAVAESEVRWAAVKSATKADSSASKAAAAWSIRSWPAWVRTTCTLRRSTVEAIRVTRPRSWARSTRPVTLDLSSSSKPASSLMVGVRSRRIPRSRAWTIDASWAAATLPSTACMAKLSWARASTRPRSPSPGRGVSRGRRAVGATKRMIAGFSWCHKL